MDSSNDDTVYRPKFFANQFLRRMIDRPDIDSSMLALLTVIAMEEDRKRYKCKYVDFWNSQLRNKLDWGSDATLNRHRGKCIAAGALEYIRGDQGSQKKPGLYRVLDADDNSCSSSNSEDEKTPSKGRSSSHSEDVIPKKMRGSSSISDDVTPQNLNSSSSNFGVHPYHVSPNLKEPSSNHGNGGGFQKNDQMESSWPENITKADLKNPEKIHELYQSAVANKWINDSETTMNSFFAHAHHCSRKGDSPGALFTFRIKDGLTKSVTPDDENWGTSAVREIKLGTASRSKRLNVTKRTVAAYFSIPGEPPNTQTEK